MKNHEWELEVFCKNKKYLKSVVKAIIKMGMIDFSVEARETIHTDPKWDSSYVVWMKCHWWHNLEDIAKELSKIEKKYDELLRE